MRKRVLWTVMVLFVLVVASYAAGAIFLPAYRSSFVRNLFTNTPAAALGHIAGGLVAIVAGALQVNASIRDRFLAFHRWLGRAYVVAVLVGSLSALALAVRSSGGLVAHFGFGLLAICWLGSTAAAYRHIRAGDQARHKDWMMRSYALTLAAVTLRIYLPLGQIAGIEFDPLYQTVAWMCWVPNLLVVEWFLVGRAARTTVAA